jgi:hypothetical protein
MIAVLAALTLCGCKKSAPPIVPVTGIVMLDGQPLPKAEVRFYPQEEGLPSNYIGMAVTDDNGRYTLMTNGQSGGCAGVNKITIAEGPPPDNARVQGAFEAYKQTLKNRPIPDRFGRLSAETLTITVAAGQSEYPIDLTR